MTNSAAANAETSLTPGASAWPWLLVALLAQTGWGMYPALARYLQTVGGLPGLSLLTVGYAPCWSPSWSGWGRAMGRSVTNVLAARYTAAIYVSLINLLTPFLVALLSTLVLRERLPRYTLPAMVLSFAGSLLMLSIGKQPADCCAASCRRCGGEQPHGPAARCHALHRHVPAG